MNNESNLQVTFSKRRSGLFKKASELCTLCGANVALIVFSPGENVFSFGHPNVDTIIDRYLSRAPTQNNSMMQFIEAHRNDNLRELNAHLTQINHTFDLEKKRGIDIINMCKESEARYRLTCPNDGMIMGQLEWFKKVVQQRIDRLRIEGGPPQMLPFFVVNGLPSNMHLHNQPNPHVQMHQAQYFHNPMMRPPNLYHGMMPHHGLNNMRGGDGEEGERGGGIGGAGGKEGGYGPPEFFRSI